MNKIVLKSPTDDDFKNLVGQAVNVIKTNGDNCRLTDKSLACIPHIIDLAELDLEWATQITDQGLSYLHGLPALKYIDLSFCSSLTDEGLRNLQSQNEQLIIER